MKPTGEQLDICDRIVQHYDLSVNAGPGTGKSTLSQYVAHTHNAKKGLYVVFNESAQKSAEGNFPGNYEVTTFHALANKHMGKLINGRKIGSISSFQLANHYDIKPTAYGAPALVATLINKTLENFCNSADENVMTSHVPDIHGVSKGNSPLINEEIGMKASELFMDIIKPGSPLPVPHGVYMKLWQLEKPQLGYDFIILDEAQDTNPVCWDVLENQNAQMMLVGDEFQQINAWRGAMNVMGMLKGSHKANLTLSFRFGEDVAKVANCLRKYHFHSDIMLRGNPALDSKIGKIASVEPTMAIFNTNYGAVEYALESLEKGRAVAINGDVKEYANMVKSAYALKNGRAGMRGEFQRFKTWDEAVDFSKSQGGIYLKKFIKTVNKNNESYFINGLNRLMAVDPQKAELLCTTAHKCKGLQGKSVLIGGDFKLPNSRNHTIADSYLLYVAITRAQMHLDESSVRKGIQTMVKKQAETVKIEAQKEVAGVDKASALRLPKAKDLEVLENEPSVF